MTNEKDREEARCMLSDEDLADKLTEWAIQLAKTGGKAWALRIPADPNYDPDLLMMEAASRVRIRAESVKVAIRKAKAYLWPDAPDFEPTPEGLEKAILSDDQEALDEGSVSEGAYIGLDDQSDCR